MNTVALLSAALGAVGLTGIIYKRTLLGVIMGIHAMFLGASVLFVVSGVQSFAIFVVVAIVANSVGGYALATRMFYLKGRAELSSLRELKR